jgi:hydrogenase nickel incorporation protein HypA/HybF
MHESSLAKQILRTVLARGARENAARVRTVRGWIAETERLSVESIAFHFDSLAKGTIAEGAKLEIDVRHVEARCAACGAVYRPDHHVLVCPRCGSTDGELLGRTGIGIETMDVEG